MRRSRAQRLTFGAACLALGCGGQAQEEAGTPETVAVDCSELQHAADAALQSLVEANNACDTDADCARAEGLGECYTYCSVPVRRANVGAVTASGRNLCRSYVEHQCSLSFACPNVPGAVCAQGRCAFGF
ncbi:MAG TPA: hypothetical protein VER11_10870 [Polyangiaceae bacterium]|nr:hypothetical protein [Polyangiaceae bacterium]